MKRLLKKSLGDIFKVNLSLLTLFATFTIGCGGGGGGSTPTTITAVDGYIVGASLKDSKGVSATEVGSGKYKFSDTPSYPLTLTGGKYSATGKNFDINLSATSGGVISPITTFLADDSALLEKLKSANLGATTLKEFEVDYIDTNNSKLAKLSQLLYVILKDSTLTTTFKSTLKSANPASLDDLFTLAESDINASTTLDFKQKYFARKLLTFTKNFIKEPSELESNLKNLKANLNGDYSDHKRVVLKTGQTISYNQAGDVVNDDSIKDDGFYQKGVARAYTRANDIVTDTVTHLMWQDDSDAATVTKKWLTDENYNTCHNDTNSSACTDTSGDTAATYCENLNLGGYTDWRLPTIEELVSITDKARIDPAIDPVFENVVSSFYWSSTSLSSNPDVGWDVIFNRGNNYRFYKDTSNYVRCVRDGN